MPHMLLEPTPELSDSIHEMADEFSAAAKSRRVRLLQILIPQRGEVSRFRVSRMDDDAVAEVQLAAGLERYSARLRFVAGECAYTERIRGEQSVGAHVPAPCIEPSPSSMLARNPLNRSSSGAKRTASEKYFRASTS